MSDYIKREDAIKAMARGLGIPYTDFIDVAERCMDDIQNADVVEADKAQKEIDYWHDKAQSYEQTILKLSLNKADVVEVVRCKDCVYRPCEMMPYSYDFDFCSYGERKDEGL